MNIKRLFTISSSILLGITIILIWSLFGPPILTRAASYTVCPAGPPTCDYNSVQSAVDAAGDGDVVKVAAGTYTGINNKGGLAQVVYIDKSITIRGGYTTTNWTNSDPVANLTTLDAEGGGRVLYITGDISPTIEGLRITGGDATVLGNLDPNWGGGVIIDEAAVTFRNNQVFGNKSVTGGGLRLDYSAATLSGNTITSNISSESGGGLMLSYSPATLYGNTISDNTASYAGQGGGGGGIMLDFSAATLNNNTIISNSAGGGGGNGGVMMLDSDNATLIGNTISNNTSIEGDGGIWTNGDNVTISGNTISNNSGVGGGGLSVGGNNVTIVGNIITSNTVTNAGGVGGGLVNHATIGVLTITGNIFSGNSAFDGGAIYLDSGNPTLTNNFIVDNHADQHGSAISICCGVQFSYLLHNTIARNSGGDGSGIWIGQGTNTLTNNIIADHTVGIYVNSGATASLESTLWGDGAWANGSDWAGSGTISTTNDLWGNPDFVDPDNDDYHIGPDSAAIDQGVDAGVTNDIDHHPRPYQEPDIGADEYWPPGALKFIYLPVINR